MEDQIALFSGRTLISILQEREHEFLQDINTFDDNNLLNTNIEDWCNLYEENYRFEPLLLKEDKIYIAQEEALVPVQNSWKGWTQEKGTKISYFIPFGGEEELFRYQPSAYISNGNPLIGKIYNDELVLEYPELHAEANKINLKFQHDLSKIQENIRLINQEVLDYNNSIRTKVKAKIEHRCQEIRQEVLHDQILVTALGYPLKPEDNMPQTNSAPTIKRKIAVSKPSVSKLPVAPDPVLEMEEYEHILYVITRMITVIERSPDIFRKIGEEDLRTHFLVQLNAHYEGQATGETFNGNGKTDILVRINDKNIFIAECKFWGGETKLRETVDQLLGYTSWRDTKTALLIFNRNKDFSAVVQKIPTAIQKHPNFKNEIDCNYETGFRCMLHHPNDINRELILTTLAFEVPQ